MKARLATIFACVVPFAALPIDCPAPMPDCREAEPVAGEAPSLLPRGKRFRLVWNDEFDGDALDGSKWGYRTTFWGRRAHWFATPDDGAVVVKDGLCHLKIVKRPDGQFVSPQLQTGELVWDIPHEENPKGFWPLPKREPPKFVHRYGYYECRCRLQRMPGWWSAFWMQTETQGTCLDPERAGIEHDIMESFEPGKIIPHCFYANGYGKDMRAFKTPILPDGVSGFDCQKTLDTENFHRFGLLWEPDGYTLFVDGVQDGAKIGHATGHPVSQVPEFLLISTECRWYREHRMTGKAHEGLEEAAAAGDEFAVDYVRVFDILPDTAAEEPWFNPQTARPQDPPQADSGMTAARIFDSDIAGLKKIGRVAAKPASAIPDSSNASVGFEGLDRGLFDPERTYDALAAAGIKWARVQTMWSRCEKQKGVLDFSVLDEVVDNLVSRGVRPWFSLTFGNALYMEGCHTGAAVGCVPTLYGDECREAWLRYVHALARRYRGVVDHWEVWNEPNSIHFWRPGKPDAAQYIELVKLASAAIKAEIPGARIGGGEACGALFDNGGWDRRFFELGGAKEIDFWCFHAYGRVPERTFRVLKTDEGDIEDYVEAMKWSRAFIDAHGGSHVELWQGESGYPTRFKERHWLFYPNSASCRDGWRSEANQAKWLLRRFAIDRICGLARSSFYQMADISRQYAMGISTQTVVPTHGLLDGWTYEPRMSYRAFANWNALLATAKSDAGAAVSLAPAEDAGAKTVAAALRTEDGRTLFIYWCAFDFSYSYVGKCYKGRRDAALTVPAALAPKEPVLVDLLRGGVYVIGNVRRDGETVVFEGLPLVDYPLAIAERSAAEGH